MLFPATTVSAKVKRVVTVALSHRSDICHAPSIPYSSSRLPQFKHECQNIFVGNPSCFSARVAIKRAIDFG